VKREDNRSGLELRPPLCKWGLLSGADGSCEFSLGLSRVIASVYGPKETATMRKTILDCAFIDVIVKPVSGPCANQDKFIQMTLHTLLRRVIDTKGFPRCTISIVVQLLHRDGSMLACCVNAAVCALLDCGMPLLFTPLAVCLSFHKNSTLLVDPRFVEISDSRTSLCFTMNSETGALFQLVPCGSVDDANAKCSGISVEELEMASNVATGIVEVLRSYIRGSLGIRLQGVRMTICPEALTR